LGERVGERQHKRQGWNSTIAALQGCVAIIVAACAARGSITPHGELRENFLQCSPLWRIEMGGDLFYAVVRSRPWTLRNNCVTSLIKRSLCVSLGLKIWNTMRSYT